LNIKIVVLLPCKKHGFLFKIFGGIFIIKGKNKGQQMKTMKFTDLLQYKKRYPISIIEDGEEKVLFSMVELGSEDFQTFMSMLFDNFKTDNEEEKQNKIFNTIGNNKLIAFLLRRMCEGIDFESMDDDEVVKTLNNISTEITQKINEVLETVMQKVSERISAISKLTEALKETGVDINEGTETNQEATE
jgi:hypothetical protein